MIFIRAIVATRAVMCGKLLAGLDFSGWIGGSTLQDGWLTPSNICKNAPGCLQCGVGRFAAPLTSRTLHPLPIPSLLPLPPSLTFPNPQIILLDTWKFSRKRIKVIKSERS